MLNCFNPVSWENGYIPYGRYPQAATKHDKCAIHKEQSSTKCKIGSCTVICSESKKGDALCFYIKDVKTRRQNFAIR